MANPLPVAVAGATLDDVHRRRSRRRSVEVLLERAQRLAPEDAQLLHQVYAQGLSIARVAETTGRHPRTLQRKVERLVRRMRSPSFRFIAQHLELLPRELQPTARDRFLYGLSLREIARRGRTSLHKVRTRVHTLETLIRAGALV
ncbi:MAG: helix-turn-helix domain-containing protein [Planctomycetota bacterium]